MAISIDGRIYRNLQEQVEENTKHICKLSIRLDAVVDNYATKVYVDNSHTAYITDSLTDNNIDKVLTAGSVVITREQLILNPTQLLKPTNLSIIQDATNLFREGD